MSNLGIEKCQGANSTFAFASNPLGHNGTFAGQAVDT